ncbi:hypothetical protein WJX72_003151 [[Myrmecia] bisecta]|uniref:DCD domain-containing protein n=1 Tax=[Myrmecia] bisecta TaxID=41462 RepID=A0AAW1QQ06_9CHLO
MAPPPGLPALRKGPPAGVIFPCANATEAAFLSASVFGMGKAQWPLVAHIRTGTPLFLFNWQSRVMHGVFSATSAGGLDLQPDLLAGIHAPTAKPCPAQVCVQRSRRCRPLQESQLRGVLAASYYDDNRFYWEIERSQVTALIALFVDSSRPNLEEGQLSLEQHPKPFQA